MKIEKHSADFNLREEFPEAELFRGWEGAAAYRATRDGKPFLVVDERTMLGLLSEEDADILSLPVTVIEFSDELEREQYVSETLLGGTILP